jgi:hypothetical protein
MIAAPDADVLGRTQYAPTQAILMFDFFVGVIWGID